VSELRVRLRYRRWQRTPEKPPPLDPLVEVPLVGGEYVGADRRGGEYVGADALGGAYVGELLVRVRYRRWQRTPEKPPAFDPLVEARLAGGEYVGAEECGGGE